MALNRRHQGEVRPEDQNAGRFGKYIRENWGVQPIAIKAADGFSAASGATGDANILVGPNSQLQYTIIGAGQTIIAPVWAAATGLDIGLDATDNEGCEITGGIGALSQGTYVIGTDRAFFVKMTAKVADVSVTDEFIIGFRKNAAVADLATTYAGYTDCAAIGIVASAATAKIQIVTNLNNAGVVTTDTTQTWADAATKTLKVVVGDDGKVQFFVNEAAPTVTAAFQFDSGDSVNWFIRHVRAATAANAVNLKPQTLTLGSGAVVQPAFETGYLRRRAE